MTYKNIKFDDSAVMRSLEKLAIKKGLAKPEEIKKEASTKPALDLTPSKDLSENILKLCSGLRASGFIKQADEIEFKYLNLKSAETSLYNLMKEKGEDMIDAAHPDGSHSLKNMEGDSIVENILDQAKKIREVAHKNPKGKLANNDIINAVKIILSGVENEVEGKTPITLLSKSINIVKKVQNMVLNSEELRSFSEWWMEKQMETINSINFNKVSIANVNDVMKLINTWRRNLQPNFIHNYIPNIFNKGLNDDDFFKTVDKMLQEAYELAKEAKSMLAQQITPSSTNTQQEEKPIITREPVSFERTSNILDFVSKIKKGKQDLMGYKATISLNRDLTPEEKKSALKWIDEQLSEFNNVVTQFSSVTEDSRESWSKDPTNVKIIDKLLEENAQFNTDWVQ